MIPGALEGPKSVAVIGVSRCPEKAGFGVFANLVRGAGGTHPLPGPPRGASPCSPPVRALCR
jgi:acyl-CoA synthetase (NDP forming)